ncbi:hypothetical protein [Polyangium aurulentum]|uniref:hypothetical protein n=1 Tax=Polyangium aurulentum TaxID=2567896 RepID=UPI0010AE23B5|nr:hypothetical protein [Polyangium aurulentum]UQA60003.1 hypothetical protein E8A73_005805 [Polyangium aurulentum]
MASNRWAMRAAIVVSILAHAAVISASGLRRERAAEVDPPLPPDQWSGNTAMPVGGELHDVDLAGGQPGPTVPPSPETTPAPEPTPPAPDPVAPPLVKNDAADEKTAEPAKPIAKADEPKEPRDKAPVVRDKEKAKQDVEDDAKDKARDDRDDAKEAPDEARADRDEKKTKRDDAKSAQDEKDDAKDKATGGADAAHAKRDAQTGGAAGAGVGSFGSAGASSVRDLGRAFMRAIPPACDSDSAWGKLSPGSAGTFEVAILVGEDGRITGWEPLKPNPPAHLASVVKRTLGLMRGGTFAIRDGAVSSGRQILRLSAEVSDVAVGADPFELGRGDWDGRKGVAYFTQTSGRHVEIKVELVRVEAG